MPQHIVRGFDVDLLCLATKIGEMGKLDRKQITDAVHALSAHDSALAEQVIRADDAVDALQRELEEKAVSTIARRQPMAVDLREIVGALRIANDLERVGDLAVNIARSVTELHGDSYSRGMISEIDHMATLVVEQLDRVLMAYAERDVAKALEVWRRDIEVDVLNNSLFRELLTYMMEDPRNITACTQLLFCAKNLERAGDHATNIAESVVYIVEGRAIPEERPKRDITNLSNEFQLAG
jgi:phosphate transport system protein